MSDRGPSGQSENRKPSVLSASGVQMNFSGVKALQGVDFDLGQSECVGVLGPNGSGKTTFVNCLSGVLRPTEGRITYNGRDITRLARARRSRLGLMRSFQNLRLFPDLTVRENVEIGLSATPGLSLAQRTDKVDEALEAHDLAAIAGRRAGELPYGAQRRTELARVLIAQPKVLLLDEPGAGLGQEEKARLSEALVHARATFDCSILIIDHDVPFVTKLSDRMILLAGGKVIRDAAPEVLLADDTLAEIYLGGAAHA